MNWKEKIRASFEKNAAELFRTRQGQEEISLCLEGEQSEFVRFNKSQVRQATSVEQAEVTLTLQTPLKLTKVTFPMTGDLQEDRRRFLLQAGRARQELEKLPDNPYPLVMPEAAQSDMDKKAETPTSEFIIKKVSSEARGDDFVGYIATGPVMRAVINSKGTSHWYSIDNYFVDYSLYNGSKAVKGLVSGQSWDDKLWSTSLCESRNFLHLMEKPVRNISRGEYRVYLAPAAVAEILALVNWGGFSFSAHKQGQSGLRLLYEGKRDFSEKLSVRANYELGFSPRFSPLGEVAPHQISLISQGKGESQMVSAKSASEYGVTSNGAGDSEQVHSMELLPGHLQRSDILKELQTGLYLSNLHYCNWSDLMSARVTGMTRFSCFWVERGEIVAPIKDLRFDVSLYDVWGPQLIAHTDFQEDSVNTSTYGSRPIGGYKVSGQLIEGFKFTL